MRDTKAQRREGTKTRRAGYKPALRVEISSEAANNFVSLRLCVFVYFTTFYAILLPGIDFRSCPRKKLRNFRLANDQWHKNCRKMH